MKQIKKIISLCGVLVFILTSFLVSCTARIDIRTDDAVQQLVIYGYITTDEVRHSVQISRSTGYFATTRPPAISDAIVTISTDDEVFELTESPDEPGVYYTEEGVTGVEGKTYTLKVWVDFEGDGILKEYEATSYLPYSLEIDNIKMKESKSFTDFVEILVSGVLPEDQENYLSFHSYRNGVIMNDSLVNFSVIDDEYVDKKELIDVPCVYLDQEEEVSKVEKGDVILLRVDILTKEYAEFIWNAQSELYGSNPLFGGPPANIPSNIKATDPGNDRQVLGFFTAYSGKTATTVYE